VTKDENALKMEEFVRETLTKDQKKYIRLGFQSVPESSVIRKRETLKITCFRNTFKPREVRRNEITWVAREIPAGRWGFLTTREQAVQTAAPPLTPIARSSNEERPCAVVMPICNQARR